MYQVFVTPGVVLNKRGGGEANTIVSLFTGELGLVRVSARSARKEISKLRYGLEPLTQGRFSLVRGAREWKLIGVEGVSREYVSPNSSVRLRSGKIARLLLRLMPGEEQTRELFDVVVEGLASLARAQEDSTAEAIECVLVLRILAHLGYLPQRTDLLPFLQVDFFSVELSAQVAASRGQLIRVINESLGATGL